MAIPAILKGDTSGSIVLDIKAGYEYAGCTLAVVFNGVRKEFAGLVAGGTKSLQYTADETAGMPLGTAHATMTLTNAAGVVRSMPWVRIRVTDIPAEIYDRHIDVDPSQLDVEPAKAGDSLGEVKAKLNAVMAFLRGGAACLLACVGLAAFGDIGPTTQLNDVPGDTTISNLVVKSGVSTGGGGGGGCDTNAVDALANAAVVTNALTVATTNRVAALETHVENTNNPHAVTAEQAGAVPLVEDKNGNKTAVTIGRRLVGTVGPGSFAHGDDVYAGGNGSHAAGYRTSAVGDYSRADGGWTEAVGSGSHASGIRAHTLLEDAYSYAWNGNGDPYYGVYYSHGPGTFNINPLGGLDGFYIGNQTLHAILLGSVTNNISATNPTFSNAVLAVGLNIDTNSVAVLNEIAETFGGFPIEGTATTVGGLLAALAAAVAWLKKNKVSSFESVGGASATVENGVAKLGDFFTESSGLKKLKNTLLESAIGTMTKTDAEGSEDATNAVTLNDNALTTVTIATATANALAVTFADARQTGGLRICELYILNGTASTDLTFDAAVQFVGTGDSFPACEAGINYFVFAEVAANKWKVTRETLKTITTPVAAA